MAMDGVRRSPDRSARAVKEKAFCALAIIVLTLRIGGVTAIFSVDSIDPSSTT